jgi:hypothetical protein
MSFKQVGDAQVLCQQTAAVGAEGTGVALGHQQAEDLVGPQGLHRQAAHTELSMPPDMAHEPRRSL